MKNKNYDFFFMLSVLANLCQLFDLDLNLNQTSNDELMQELQKQDKLLDEQTKIYLEKIVKQNDEIIRLLKER